MDEMRAMLDQLMGKERNMNLEERDNYTPAKKYFNDPDVCKHYLCGFCPYEEFRRTKNDCGDCPAVHDDDCRRQWEQLPDREKERYGYERELMRWMERLLADLRKRIESNTERLATTQRPLYLAEDQAALDAMTSDIDALLTQAAKLGEEGEVDAAQAATVQAEELRVRRTALERAADARSGNNATRNLVQSVCPVSGLIINDEESRLRDHHSGRNYNSWKKLHDVHVKLMDLLQRRGRPPAMGDQRGMEAPGRRDMERDHYRHDRGRDRDYDRRQRRSRSPERARHRRRSRSRSRTRRHRDRGDYSGRGDRDYRDKRERRERDRDWPEAGRERDEGEQGAEEGELKAPPPAEAPANGV